MTLQHKKKLFSREYPDLFDYLYKYVCFRISNRSEAEDLVSESILQAYGRLSDFDIEKGSLKQWMTGITKNRLLMYWRAQKMFVELDAIEELSDQEDTMLDRLDVSMMTEKIFDRLTEKDRVMLTLRYIDGYSHDEIADSLGKQSAAVRKYFSRLLKQIQQYA